MANLQTAAPQFASNVPFKILLPEASDMALADMIYSLNYCLSASETLKIYILMNRVISLDDKTKMVRDVKIHCKIEYVHNTPR